MKKFGDARERRLSDSPTRSASKSQLLLNSPKANTKGEEKKVRSCEDDVCASHDTRSIYTNSSLRSPLLATLVAGMQPGSSKHIHGSVEPHAQQGEIANATR